MGLRLDAYDFNIELVIRKGEADKWLPLLAVRLAVDNEEGIELLHGKLDMAVKKELASRANNATVRGDYEVEECDIFPTKSAASLA
eukprot:3152792-Pleurochrysis_carterae.AAC.2